MPSVVNLTKTRFPPVRTKANFVRRYTLGEFGNRAPTWNTLDEFLRADYSGLVHIRNRIAGGQTWYNVPDYLVEPTYWKRVLPSGLRPDQVYFSAMAPTEKTLIQGEVYRRYDGLYFLYSMVKKPMREALAELWEEVRGVKAIGLLNYFMYPNSYSWLETLLERYPDHVVELSVYDCEWGTVPGHNTVIWEVRAY